MQYNCFSDVIQQKLNLKSMLTAFFPCNLADWHQWNGEIISYF